MNKQAYFTMMKMACLNKKAETETNVIGPVLGAMLAGGIGDSLATSSNNKSNFLSRLMWILPLAALGLYAGNRFQNHWNNTNRKGFWEGLDYSSFFDKLFPGKKTPNAGTSTPTATPQQKPVVNTPSTQPASTTAQPKIETPQAEPMTKREYFKLMRVSSLFKTAAKEKIARLDPEYEKYIGPAAGAVIGATQGYQLAKLIHGKPGFWEKLFYVLPSLGLGVYAGTRIQDELQKTDNRLAFMDNITKTLNKPLI